MQQEQTASDADGADHDQGNKVVRHSLSIVAVKSIPPQAFQANVGDTHTGMKAVLFTWSEIKP